MNALAFLVLLGVVIVAQAWLPAGHECEHLSCTRHACYDDGGCHEHGEAS